MNIARILYPVEVLGPGKRLAIWTAGCNHYCKGCSNAELWQKSPDYEISIKNLEKAITEIFFLQGNKIDGITLTGGDPFFQSEELPDLLEMLQKLSDDILVYTGYEYEELKKSKDMHIQKSLSLIDVLIDGPYIEELNNNASMRGSSNQKIVILNKKLKNKYMYYLERKNRIQNFVTADGIISVGIHKKDFREKSNERGFLFGEDS